MGHPKTAPGPLVLHQHQHQHQHLHLHQHQHLHLHQHQHQRQNNHHQQPGYSASSSIPTPGETSQGLLLKAPGNIDRSPSPSSSPRSLYTSKFSPRLHDHAQFSNSAPRPSPAPSQQSFKEPSQEALASGKDSLPSASPQPQPRANKAEQHQHDNRSNRQRQHLGPQDSPPSTAAAVAIAHETKQLHIAELQQRLPSITRSLTASSTHQPPQPEYRHPVRRLKSTRGRRRDDDDDDAVPAHQNKQGFFLNFHKPARSSDRLPLPLHAQGNPTTVTPTAASAREAMNGTKQPPNAQQHPSKQADAPSIPSRSETSLAGGSDPNSTHIAATKKPPKPKPFALLGRTKSHRDKDGRSPRHTPSPKESREPIPVPKVPGMLDLDRSEQAHVAQTPKTATVPNDRSFRDAMSSSPRNRSADRAPSRDASSDRRGHHDREHSRHQSHPRDGNGASSFFNNLRREGGRVAESIGKGLFGKGGRSASTTERELVDDEHYVLKVINLPLVEQTRMTRISKRLEESRDKTEFWMPAFPWRAIDYLNYKGCDVEGLYRVPGSGPQIKKWQRRFDEQYDVDLFMQDDLYDINIIGSMLKAWLRELPDELFPKEAQDRVARECAGADKVPQLLVDELSNLSPFNYYLLFAITCHLSLLLAHSEKNKMDFRNLCICFQPCMKIDAFCFKFLVCEWRDCWKGCKTEARYIEEEYRLFDQPPPPGLGVRRKLEPRTESRGGERRRSPHIDRDDRDRAISSSDSNSKKFMHGADSSRLKKKSPPPLESGKENGTVLAKPVNAELQGECSPIPQDPNDLRPLSPIKPLSPLGF